MMGNGALSNMEDCRELWERNYLIDGLVLNRYFIDEELSVEETGKKKYKNSFLKLSQKNNFLTFTTMLTQLGGDNIVLFYYMTIYINIVYGR